VSRLPVILLGLGCVLAGFGWWGLNTRAGRRIFDEMAGMIPMAVLGLGALLLVAGVLLSVWPRSRA
jgi:hypothetical protein